MRRLLSLAVLGLLVAGLVALDRRPVTTTAPDLGAPAAAVQPVVHSGDLLTDTWFCAGVPAASDGSAGGSIRVTNQGGSALSGTVTYLPSEGDATSVDVSVAPHGHADLVVTDTVKAPFVAAVVALSSGGAFVEQSVTAKSGIGISPCTSDPSPTWYLADGATTVDAGYRVLLSNPFPDDAIVDLSFATDEGPRTPQALQGFVVPARSLKVVKVDDHVRRNTLVSTAVVARTGRIVVGRYQGYALLPRRGIVSGLAAPAAGAEWWFANGQKGGGTSERLVLFNPGKTDVDLDISLFPADPVGAVPIEPLAVTVPGAASTVLDLSASDVVPEGRHSIRVASTGGEPVVAERIIDLTGEDRKTTTLQPGSLVRSQRWVASGAAPGKATTSLIVLNPLGTDTTVRLLVLGPNGYTAVAGADGVALPGAGTLRLQAPADGSPVMVEAGGPVVVERMLVPGANQAGAASAYALPVVEP